MTDFGNTAPTPHRSVERNSKGECETEPTLHRIVAENAEILCREYAGPGPCLMLLPSNGANGGTFAGLVKAGLQREFRLMIPEVVGVRRPIAPHRYFDASCRDLLAILDFLELDTVALGGHSIGALQALYFAANHPERVEKLILLEACNAMARPALSCVDCALLESASPRVPPSHFRRLFSMSPFAATWYAELKMFIEEDLGEDFLPWMRRDAPDGAEAGANDIIKVARRKNWVDYGAHIRASRLDTISIKARNPMPADIPAPGIESAAGLEDILAAHTVEVPGNHITMLTGQGAIRTVQAIGTWNLARR